MFARLVDETSGSVMEARGGLKQAQGRLRDLRGTGFPKRFSQAVEALLGRWPPPFLAAKCRQCQGLGRTTVLGHATGVEEFPGLQAVVLCLQLPYLLVVGMAEYLLEFLDFAGFTVFSLLIGRHD